MTPKYRTDAQACSCRGFWYRKTCRHWRAYREAQALVLAQDGYSKWRKRRCTGLSEGHLI